MHASFAVGRPFAGSAHCRCGHDQLTKHGRHSLHPAARFLYRVSITADGGQVAKRLDGLDAIKVIAAAVIVLEHSVLRGTKGDSLAYFIYGACHVAVPTFFAVAGYIAGLKPATGSLAEFARRRAKRLLIPAAFWIAFYQLYAVWLTGRAPWKGSVGSWLLVNFGGGGFAWFLVVLFIVSVLANALDRRVTGLWPSFVGLAIFVALGFVQPKGPIGLGFGTFNVFVFAYGAAYWAAMRLARTQWRPSRLVAVSTVGVLVVLAGALQLLRQSTGLQSWSWLMYASASVAALAVVAIAIDPGVSWEWVLKPFGWARECTLGIYIVHPAYLGLIFARMPLIDPLLRTFLTATVTFLVTAAGVALARRSKLGRALL